MTRRPDAADPARSTRFITSVSPPIRGASFQATNRATTTVRTTMYIAAALILATVHTGRVLNKVNQKAIETGYGEYDGWILHVRVWK